MSDATTVTPTTKPSLFKSVKPLAPDAIFDLTTRFRADPHPDKLNLGVGAYRDEELKPYTFSAVTAAKTFLLESGANHEYAPIVGIPEFRAESAKLALGAASAAIAEARVSSCQTVGGTGALAIAFALLRTLLGESASVALPTPTWGNHRAIVLRSGFASEQILSYSLYNPETKGLDFEAMTDGLRALPAGTVVLLQACAFNPTGVDPTVEQWDAILRIIQEQELFPIFDSAYQGFASGDLSRDAWVLRQAEKLGMEFFLAQSFSKNMGMYGERVGCLHMVARSEEAATALLTRAAPIVRSLYSNSPKFGASVVAKILSSPELYAVWTEELRAVVERIQKMRSCLVAALAAEGVEGDWSHITSQIGMFSFTGLTPEQVAALQEHHHVYMLRNGRISLSGLNDKGCAVLAHAIAQVLATRACGESPTQH